MEVLTVRMTAEFRPPHLQTLMKVSLVEWNTVYC